MPQIQFHPALSLLVAKAILREPPKEMELQDENNKTLLDLLEEFTTPEDILERLYGKWLTKGTAADLLDYVVERIDCAGTLELQSFCNITEDLCKESSFWQCLYRHVFTDLYNLFLPNVHPFLPRNTDLGNIEPLMVIVSPQFRKPAFWRDLYMDTLAVTENELRNSAFKRLVNKEPPLTGDEKLPIKQLAFESFDEFVPLSGDERVLSEFPRAFPTLSVIIARSQGHPGHFLKILVSHGRLDSYLGLSQAGMSFFFPYMSEEAALSYIADCPTPDDLSNGLKRAVGNGWMRVTEEILALSSLGTKPPISIFRWDVYRAAIGHGYSSRVFLMLLRDPRCLPNHTDSILDMALRIDNNEAIELLLGEMKDPKAWCSLDVKAAFSSNISLETLAKVFKRHSECMLLTADTDVLFHGEGYVPDESFKITSSERCMETVKLFVDTFGLANIKDLTINILPDAGKDVIRFLFSACRHVLFSKREVRDVFSILHRRGMVDVIVWLIKNREDTFRGGAATRFASATTDPLIFSALIEEGATLTVEGEFWRCVSFGDVEKLSVCMGTKGFELESISIVYALLKSMDKGFVEFTRLLLSYIVSLRTLTELVLNNRYAEDVLTKALTDPGMGLMLLEEGLDLGALPLEALIIVAVNIGIDRPWTKEGINQLYMKEYKRQLSLSQEDPSEEK